MTPEMPGPFTVFLKDGSNFGAELVYDGVIDGAHQWRITSTIPDGQLDRIEGGVLPAKTSLIIPMRHGS